MRSYIRLEFDIATYGRLLVGQSHIKTANKSKFLVVENCLGKRAMYEEWKEYFSERYEIFGNGKQTSRASFCLQNCPKRFFKIEEASDEQWRISLMTRNYDVDINSLRARIDKLGFSTKKKQKYLEVLINDFDDAMQCNAWKYLRI